MNNTLRNTLAVGFAALMLSGCMAKPHMHVVPANSAWTAFHATDEVHASAFTTKTVLSGSLRFGLPQDTRRVTYTLWAHVPAQSGKETDQAPETRLEVYAGAGPSLCSALFKDGWMTVLLHQERQAWTGEATKENLRKLLGIPLPLDLAQLYAFLEGRYYTSLGSPVPVSSSVGERGESVFSFGKSLPVRELSLRNDGKPLRLKTWDGWDLHVSYGEEQLPVKLDGNLRTTEGDLRFLLLVKDRAQQAGSEAHAGLRIPSGYRLASLVE